MLALILTSSGHKGISGKNLYPVLGWPLVDYTIAAVNEGYVIVELILSLDEPEILHKG